MYPVLTFWNAHQDVPEDSIDYTKVEEVYGKNTAAFFEEVSYGKLHLNITFYRYTVLMHPSKLRMPIYPRLPSGSEPPPHAEL